MPCEHIPFGDGGAAFICSRGRPKKPPACRVQGCERESEFLCDWPTSPGRTCSAPLCAEHAHEIGPDRHLCPKHAQMHLEQQRQPNLFHGESST